MHNLHVQCESSNFVVNVNEKQPSACQTKVTSRLRAARNLLSSAARSYVTSMLPVCDVGPFQSMLMLEDEYFEYFELEN